MTDDQGATNENMNNQPPKVDSLLPPAKIHLFSYDLETLNLFHTLGEDWRFGRVNMGIRGDNLDEAIAHYERRKSPTLIIIQTETTDQAFQDRLADLAVHCDEGTAAIIIGPVNDVQLYRHLISIGISDYLVAPIETESLVEAIASSLQDLVGAVDTHLIATIGVKGGVGTTSISSLIADTLGNQLESKTLLMDACGGASTLWNHFAFSPSGTLIEAARAIVDKDEDALKRLIIKNSDNLHILNSGAENILDNPVAGQAYEMLLDHCLSLYPYIVADASGAPTQIKRMILGRANVIFIVTTPNVPDLSMTKLLMKEISDMPGMESRKPTIILNNVGQAKGAEIDVNDVKEALGVKDIIVMPYDGNTFTKAENGTKSLSENTDFNTLKSRLKSDLARVIGLNNFDAAMEKKIKRGLPAILSKLMRGK
jgi:pilus assembly protein CpaE